MDVKEYKAHTEKKLVREFVMNFHDKLGYYPIVITDAALIKKNDYNTISLDALEGYFETTLIARVGRDYTLSSKSKLRNLAELRYIFFHIARTMKYNLNEIGTYCGGRDHTTVIHGLKMFKNLSATDPSFKDIYHHIVNLIKKDHELPTLENDNKVEIKSESGLLSGLLPRQDNTIKRPD